MADVSLSVGLCGDRHDDTVKTGKGALNAPLWYTQPSPYSTIPSEDSSMSYSDTHSPTFGKTWENQDAWHGSVRD